MNCILVLVFSASFIVVLPSKNTSLLLVNYAILGLVLIPVQQVGLMLVNEMCQGQDQALSNGFISGFG
jgi:hypothetical protein